MSTADRGEDELYRACITWNVPAIRHSDREDASAFLRTIQLLPSAFGHEDRDALTGRMSHLKRATLGLRAELSGDFELAKELYSIVARQRGPRGLLGLLLLAWMSDAQPRDFDNVELRLSRLSGPGSMDVIARCHCKLATWAGDHGWTERAAHHFERARSAAGSELGAQLDEIGNWFGADQILRFGRARQDMTRFPWIQDWADQAAHKTVEDQFKRSFRSPWTRVWTLGSGSVEGSDIQSAELQASWAGALWMLPPIQRQHAALILSRSRETEDVVRGIALWVRGGGATPGTLIESLEGHLTRESVEELLVAQLHEGRSVTRSELWWDSCLALWSELPQRLTDSIVAGFEWPTNNPDPYDDDARRLTLLGYLLTQSDSATAKALGMSDAHLAVLLRTLPPGLVDRLHPTIVERGLRAALSGDEGSAWRQTGWPTLVRAWWLLPAAARDDLRQRLVGQLPSQVIAEAATVVPGLIPPETLQRSLNAAVAQVEGDIEDAYRGRFSRRTREPATAIGRLVGMPDVERSTAIVTLIRQASSPPVAPVQRQAALAALVGLARDGLVGPDVVEPALVPVLQGAVSALMSDDEDTDQRYEDVQRLALRLALRQEERLHGAILAASRDPSTRVRALALSTVRWLTIGSSSSGALDAALLGALYDPHPLVQAHAVPGIWRGRFSSDAVRQVAQDRMVELWRTAHLEVRIAVAREASIGASTDDRLSALAAWAQEDRSVLVRWAVESTGE